MTTRLGDDAAADPRCGESKRYRPSGARPSDGLFFLAVAWWGRQEKSGDCLVGCAAGASMVGVSLFRGATPKKVKRNRKHVAYL